MILQPLWWTFWRNITALKTTRINSDQHLLTLSINLEFENFEQLVKLRKFPKFCPILFYVTFMHEPGEREREKERKRKREIAFMHVCCLIGKRVGRSCTFVTSDNVSKVDGETFKHWWNMGAKLRIKYLRIIFLIMQ